MNSDLHSCTCAGGITMENKVDFNDVSISVLLKKKKTGLIIHGVAMLILGYWPVIAYFVSEVMSSPENWLLFLKDCIEMPLYEHIICLSGNVFLIPRLYFLYRSYKERLLGNKKRAVGYMLLWVFALAAGIAVFVTALFNVYLDRARKPVIYLYPETKTEVSVKLELDGKLTAVYPDYDAANGWTVTAEPDGTLTDKKGRQYSYLYWEGDVNIWPDMSRGFCVKGEDTAEFLENALKQTGLTDKEADDFITYWLPEMQENKYNVITFQTKAYEEVAALRVAPKPDTVIRVYMLWYPSKVKVNIRPQELDSVNPAVRKGFTVVEWGGEEYKRGALRLESLV